MTEHKVSGPSPSFRLTKKKLKTLMPDSVFSYQQITDSLNFFSKNEQAIVVNSVKKRQTEFITGRSCARAAIKSLGDPPQSILKGKHGAPIWPQNIVGSISHCKNMATAICSKKKHHQSIGIDIELNNPLATNIVPAVLTKKEQQFLKQTTNINNTVFFSIKESVFKCYYPLTNELFDFLDVEISINAKTESFSIKWLQKNQPMVSKSLVFFGCYFISTEHIISVCSLKPT